MENKEAELFWERYGELADGDMEVARATGIRQSTLSTWKGKGRFPGADDAVKIARKLKTTVEYLVTGEVSADQFAFIQKIIGFAIKISEMTPKEREEIMLLVDCKHNKKAAQEDRESRKREKRSEKMTQALFVGEPMPAYGDKSIEKEPSPLYIVRDNETGEDVSQVPWDANVVFLNEGLVEIPEIGTTAAGSPIDFEDIDPDPPMRLWAAGFIRGDRENYRCVRVQGSSMTEADIQDGDRALLVRARTAENGEIMLVRDEDSSTLKRIRVTKGPDGREEVWMCWEDGSGHREMLNGGHQIQARLVAIERKPRKK